MPQPRHWGRYTVAAQHDDPRSFLNLYRAALAQRSRLWMDAGDVRWLGDSASVLRFSRGAAQCWVNTGSGSEALPEGAAIVLASDPGIESTLPPDTAVWFR